jgi:short-subunit dehydrogenase
LVARDRQALRKVADELSSEYKSSVKVMAEDLAMPAAPDNIFRELERDRIDVDVLVNNAGFGVLGPFAKTDLAAELAMLQVHMASLTHLTKLFLRKMLARGEGKILNVASTAAFQPGPHMAVYYATKAYVLSFSEALASELHGSGVTVSVLCPGTTRTAFQQRAGMRPSALLNRIAMSAAAVAAAGYKGLGRNQTVIVPGFANKLFAFTVRIAPRHLVTTIVRRIQGKRIQA